MKRLTKRFLYTFRLTLQPALHAIFFLRHFFFEKYMKSSRWHSKHLVTVWSLEGQYRGGWEGGGLGRGLLNLLKNTALANIFAAFYVSGRLHEHFFVCVNFCHIKFTPAFQQIYLSHKNWPIVLVYDVRILNVTINIRLINRWSTVLGWKVVLYNMALDTPFKTIANMISPCFAFHRLEFRIVWIYWYNQINMM